MDLIFATCESLPGITPDDQPLADALGALGVAARGVPWTDIAPGGDTPVLLRSTWDYYLHADRFRAWLDALAASGTRVFNPPAIAAWNMDKAYLGELSQAGVTIPRTRWVGRPDADALERVLAEEGWRAAVLKPRISATAHGTMIIRPDAMPSAADLAPVRAAGALVQEFVAEVRDHGELSLVYFDGAYSHAVRKRARPGDFRVQSDHGGTVEDAVPSEASRALAAAAIAAAPGPCLYARVDLVEAAAGPLLMELELIEPELFLLHDRRAAGRLADLINLVI
ncbi:MAG: RimK family alpha-L-glutamate ligase [Vicinamibacterales bacterium]